MPIARQISFYGCSEMLSLDTIQSEEIEAFSAAVVILGKFM